MSHLFWLYLILLCALGTHTASGESLSELVDDFFAWRLKESPEYALSYALPFYQYDVEEWNEEAFQRRLAKAKDFKARADSIDPASLKDKQQKLDLRILKFDVDTYIAGYEYRRYTAGFNVELVKLDDYLRLANVQNETQLRFWYERMLKYTPMVRNETEKANTINSSDYALACSAADYYIDALEKRAEVDDEEFFALQPWKDLNTQPTNETFYNEGRKASLELKTALTEWKNAMNNHYKDFCRANEGASSMPNGEDFYLKALQFHTSAEMTPEKVHQKGQQEVERIMREINKILKEEGFNSMLEYKDHLLTQPDQTYSSTEAVLEELRQIYERVKPLMSKVFNFEITAPVEMVNIPGSGMGSYSPPATDGSRSARFIIDASKPQNIQKVYLLPLTLHETLPGHHLSFIHDIESGLHRFRRLADHRRLAQVPFTWPINTALVEGWALYSESLSEELGIITTNQERFGKLSAELFRAVRLVVDTGIHYYNWTVDRAVEYMAERSAFPEDSVREEIIRYVRWPGQACAYKVGELKIKQLQKKAEDKLGDNFNLKDFHDVVLRPGHAPLEVIEDEVNDWIESKQKTSSASRNFLPTFLIALQFLYFI